MHILQLILCEFAIEKWPRNNNKCITKIKTRTVFYKRIVFFCGYLNTLTDKSPEREDMNRPLQLSLDIKMYVQLNKLSLTLFDYLGKNRQNLILNLKY